MGDYPYLSELENLTDRHWFKSEICGISAISYCNSGMSYGYDFLANTFLLLGNVDGLRGIHGKVETLFVGSFEECRSEFFKRKL